MVWSVVRLNKFDHQLLPVLVSVEGSALESGPLPELLLLVLNAFLYLLDDFDTYDKRDRK